MNVDDPEFYHAMLVEFCCEHRASGSGRESRSTTRKRERLDTAKRHFAAVCGSVHTKEDALCRVKERWTVGMGPVAAYVLWMLIGELVKKFVFWAWGRMYA